MRSISGAEAEREDLLYKEVPNHFVELLFTYFLCCYHHRQRNEILGRI